MSKVAMYSPERFQETDIINFESGVKETKNTGFTFSEPKLNINRLSKIEVT